MGSRGQSWAWGWGGAATPALVPVSDDGRRPGLAHGWTGGGTGSSSVKSVMSGPNGLASDPSRASWGAPRTLPGPRCEEPVPPTPRHFL